MERRAASREAAGSWSAVEEQCPSSEREQCAPSNRVILQGLGFFFTMEKYRPLELSGVNKIA